MLNWSGPETVANGKSEGDKGALNIVCAHVRVIYVS